jgi:hypothetical protein
MLGTAGTMALVGWRLPGFDMAGPRPGTRIALLVPQLEVSLVFLVGLPLWSQTLSAERSAALRAALATTARGRLRAVLRGAGAGLTVTAPLVTGGAVAWILALFLQSGPSMASALATRLLLVAFVVFALGLGVCISARCPDALSAAGTAAAALAVMAGAPFAIAPLISAFGTHWLIVQAAVLLCPWVVAAGVSGLDLVHMQWIYALSPLGHVELTYPGLVAACLGYGAAGGLLLLAAVRALRPARGSVAAFG